MGSQRRVEPGAARDRPATMLGRSLLLFGLVVAVTLVAGCQFLSSAATGPLVTLTTRGGKCVDGPCGSVMILERNGTVRIAEPTAEVLGDVPDVPLDALAAAISATDFDAIRSRPFKGECPVAFDGQEIIFEFAVLGGVERVASCETEIDPTDPLFVALNAAFEAVNVPAPVAPN